MPNLNALLRANFEASIQCKQAALATMLPAMERAAELLIVCYRDGGKAIFFGNGGSAADAQHLAAEFLGRYLRERRSLPALALATNSSTMTAIGNDYGYEQTFSRQVAAWVRPGDVAVGISTSGNSANVVAAMQKAREGGATTIGLTGAGGGKMRAVADVLLEVPSRDTPRIQECHILIGHALCQAIEEALFAS